MDLLMSVLAYFHLLIFFLMLPFFITFTPYFINAIITSPTFLRTSIFSLQFFFNFSFALSLFPQNFLAFVSFGP